MLREAGLETHDGRDDDDEEDGGGEHEIGNLDKILNLRDGEDEEKEELEEEEEEAIPGTFKDLRKRLADLNSNEDDEEEASDAKVRVKVYAK